MSPLFRIVALLVLLTLVSQFFRVAYGAIAPDLLRDLHLSAGSLSLAGGAFFLGLGLAQVPVGMAFDRIGVRRTVAALTVIAVIGAIGNALARDAVELVAARLVIGIGCGGSFMGAVVLTARWVPAERYALVLSWVFALSNIGTLMAGTPLAFLTEAVGWRGSFLVIAAVAAVVGIVFYAGARDAPPGAPVLPASRESLGEILRGLASVLGARGLAHTFAVHAVAYAAVVTLLGLWAAPYLQHVHGLDTLARGNVLFAMAIGQIAGIVAYGPLDRVIGRRKPIIVAGALMTALALVGLAMLPAEAAYASYALLVLFCLIGAYSVVIVAHGRSLFPPALLGRGVTTVNLAQVAGSFALPYLSGLIVQWMAPDGAPYPVEAYSAVFLFLAASLVVGAAIFAFGPDSRPYTAPARTPEPALAQAANSSSR
jgi:MFS family permease